MTPESISLVASKAGDKTMVAVPGMGRPPSHSTRFTCCIFLSPFLYAVFIDSVLGDLCTRGAHLGVRVGAQDWERSLAGQLYADDLASLSSPPRASRA